MPDVRRFSTCHVDDAKARAAEAGVHAEDAKDRAHAAFV
jgi:hypothetical protein